MAANKTKAEVKAAELAKIHIAKQQLGLEDDSLPRYAEDDNQQRPCALFD